MLVHREETANVFTIIAVELDTRCERRYADIYRTQFCGLVPVTG